MDDLANQLVVWATVVGAVAALPTLLEFLIDRRRQRELVELSIDDQSVANVPARSAGFEDLLDEIGDLIDRAKHPEQYRSLKLGNEMLVIGPPLGGKKSFAYALALRAGLERVVTVFNARSAPALVRAKELVVKAAPEKVLLLLPRIDVAFMQENEEVLTELEALIESCSGRENVLVVGTATTLVPDSPLDNLFGCKVVLPGTERSEPSSRPVKSDALAILLRRVADFYLSEALHAGFSFDGISLEEAATLILAHANNPAEVEDIVVLAQTAALYAVRSGKTKTLSIDRESIERACGRVVVALRDD